MADIDIQGLWAKGKQINRSNAPVVDIDQAIKGKSRTTLYWIKVILWIELIINVVSLPFVLDLLHKEEQYGAMIFFLIVVIIYVAYYIFLIRSINRFNYLDNVKSSLRRLYKYLNYYLLHYKVLIWTMFPASFLYGFWIGYKEESGGELPEAAGEWAFLIGVLLISIAMLVLVSTWLVNLIYGKKIKRLKGMVKELEEAE